MIRGNCQKPGEKVLASSGGRGGGARNIIWDELARELINGHEMELWRGQWVGPEGLGGRGKTNWGKVNDKRRKRAARRIM